MNLLVKTIVGSNDYERGIAEHADIAANTAITARADSGRGAHGTRDYAAGTVLHQFRHHQPCRQRAARRRRRLPDDIIDPATISGADYINVGTLLPFYKDALPQVARAFHNTGHPWVLDPVAAGIGETRTAILQSFKRYPPTVIRGNASEIIALDAMWGLNEESATATASKPAGVESVDDVESAIAPAQRLARFMARHGANGTAAVAVSGATDMVTDGEHVYRLAGGSAMMTKITGAGCSLGGVTAVYLAVAQPLIAALAATSLYNTAGEIAEVKSDGPGSFQVALLDALWNVTAEEVADRAIDMR